MPASELELFYEPGDATAEELDAEVAATIEEERARIIDLTEGNQIEIRVREDDRQGFEPVTIIVAIGTQVGIHVGKKVWDDIVWPRIKRKFGVGALGPKLDEKPS